MEVRALRRSPPTTDRLHRGLGALKQPLSGQEKLIDQAVVYAIQSVDCYKLGSKGNNIRVSARFRSVRYR